MVFQKFILWVFGYFRVEFQLHSHAGDHMPKELRTLQPHNSILARPD